MTSRSRGVFFGWVLVCWDAKSFADSFNWMLDLLSVEKSTRDCPKRPRRNRLAVHFACCVTKTSSMCRVAALLRSLQSLKKSWPSSQRPPVLVRMKGRQKFSFCKRPAESFRGYALSKILQKIAVFQRFSSNFGSMLIKISQNFAEYSEEWWEIHKITEFLTDSSKISQIMAEFSPTSDV